MPPTNQEPVLTSTSVSTKSCPWYQPLCHVTPVSKYLAMVIFIMMPFVGGYIGYKLAPERVVEVPVSVTDTPQEDPFTFQPSDQVEQQVFNDIELPQIEWKDNLNDYTVAERSRYQSLNEGERVANFFYARKDGVILVADMNSAQVPYKSLKQADPDTFVINVLWPSYARDKNHVYILGEVIEGADPKTFVPVCGFVPSTAGSCGFSKDDHQVFWYTKPIKGADVASFAYLYGGKDFPSFALDKSAVYRGEYLYFLQATSTERIKLDSVMQLASGEKISFTQTKNMKVGEVETWAPYLAFKSYSDGEFNYVENVTFIDGVDSYSLYEKIKSTDKTIRSWYLSKVKKMGDKPAEIK